MTKPMPHWPTNAEGRALLLSEMTEAQRRLFQPFYDQAVVARAADTAAHPGTGAHAAKARRGPVVEILIAHPHEWAADPVHGMLPTPLPPTAVRIYSVAEAVGQHYVVFGVENQMKRLWSVVKRNPHGGYLPVAHHDKLTNAVKRAAMLNAGIAP